MLYHYTTQKALESILREADTHQQMCFWATRYDCFADTGEWKLGVETIRRLLPEVEKEMPTDRQIAPLFDWDDIMGNKNLPYPYTVSFSARPDNDYMWKEYAKTDGVVLEIDDSQNVPVKDIPFRLAPCFYADGKSDEKIIDMLRHEYQIMGFANLIGTHQEFAWYLLKENPQAFVKLIAIALLSLTAPRIKDAKDYWMEEETRAIISLPIPVYNENIKGYDGVISSLGLNPEEVRTFVADEHTRIRDNGSIAYYREMHLPVHLLKGVYVKSREKIEQVGMILKALGLVVPVVEISFKCK